MQESAICDGVQEVSLSHWREFFDLSMSVFAKAPAYIYRGQTDYN
jgi:hypothetical protein